MNDANKIMMMVQEANGEEMSCLCGKIVPVLIDAVLKQSSEDPGLFTKYGQTDESRVCLPPVATARAETLNTCRVLYELCLGKPWPSQPRHRSTTMKMIGILSQKSIKQPNKKSKNASYSYTKPAYSTR